MLRSRGLNFFAVGQGFLSYHSNHPTSLTKSYHYANFGLIWILLSVEVKNEKETRRVYRSTNADLSVQSRGWHSVDPRHLGDSENRLTNFLESKILKKIKKH